MNELHLPFLELSLLAPLAGALWTFRLRDPERVMARSCVAIGATLLLAVAAWRDFATLRVFEAHDRGSWLTLLLGSDFFVVDELNAPLLTLASLLYFCITLATLRTKQRRFSFHWSLISLALALALLSCRDPWGIITLLIAQTFPPWLELRRRGRPTRVFAWHLGASSALLVFGWGLYSVGEPNVQCRAIAVALLAAAILIRSGAVPFHCWMTDLFENATLGTALLFVTPMSGAYAAMRLLLPVAPAWALKCVALVSLATAVYAAGMALVQREARRFFCFLFLSQSSLVLAGLELASPIALAGGLCVWLSVGLSLAGLGLTLRALESRTGRLTLANYQGLYDHMPGLGVFFLVSGLASIGFPGTVGFIGAELLVEGAMHFAPAVGVAVVLVTALNGIAILQTYFRLFTGARRTTSICLNARLPERIVMLTLTALIVGGGLWPQPGIASRFHAAEEILARRRALRGPETVRSLAFLPNHPVDAELPAEVDENPGGVP